MIWPIIQLLFLDVICSEVLWAVCCPLPQLALLPNIQEDMTAQSVSVQIASEKWQQCYGTAL